MIALDCIQGSPEWHRVRLGVVTASRVSEILTPGKLHLSKARAGYMNALLYEWATGQPADGDFGGTYWTERGTELEGEAADYFRLMTELEPVPVGFVNRNEDRQTGASPDWLVLKPDNGPPFMGVELKCPKGEHHVAALRADEAPTKYWPQIQYSLWVTGFETWWFMSYCPGLPPAIIQCFPDARWHEAFDEHIPVFVDEMLAARDALRAMGVRAVLDES